MLTLLVTLCVASSSRALQVLAEMVARGMVGNFDQPSALLIAPTTSLVAIVAMQEDAALRIQRKHNMDRLGSDENRSTNSRTSNDGAQVHVVHGVYDISFCPDQHRWNRICGVQLHIVHDNHVISRPSSLRVLVHILELLLAGDSVRGFSGSEASSAVPSA